jgi:hypothetical protein
MTDLPPVALSAVARNARQHYNSGHQGNLHRRLDKRTKEKTLQTSKDPHLLKLLLKGTRFGLVNWKRTAGNGEKFTAALRGGYVATVWKDNVRQYCRLESSAEQSQTLVSSDDSEFVEALCSEVKRNSFSVHRAHR